MAIAALMATEAEMAPVLNRWSKNSGVSWAKVTGGSSASGAAAAAAIPQAKQESGSSAPGAASSSPAVSAPFPTVVGLNAGECCMLTVSIFEGPSHDREKVPRLCAPARAGPLMRDVAQRIAPKKDPRSAEGKQEFYT